MPSTRKARELPKVWTREEVQALMKRPNLTAPTGLRNRCMLELMHRGGLRVGELCQLRMRDVRKDGTVHLRPEITKYNVERYVDVPNSVVELIEQWKVVRRAYARGSDLLFCTLKGTPVTPHYVWQMMGRYGQKAGITGPWKPHRLRHTYATELLQEGFDIRQIQELLGHQHVDTTAVYTHIARPELRRRLRERG